MGDGAGVGPEVTVGALLDRNATELCRPSSSATRTGWAKPRGPGRDRRHRGHRGTVRDAVFEPGRINVIDLDLLPPDLPWGELSAVAGNAAYHYIRVACELGMRGEVQAICTAPLNKEALHAAGHVYPGHTELLAHLTGIEEVSMMLSTPKVKVIHVTTHIGLIDAVTRSSPAWWNAPCAAATTRLAARRHPQPQDRSLRHQPARRGERPLRLRRGEPRRSSRPSSSCRPTASTPAARCPADTAFFLAGRGDYDLIVAMYHDQGHGPVKVLGIEAGVNITVGLPVIRTSVDHGTAFDIAGKGIVDVRSMIEALRQAAEMSPSPVAAGS